MDKELDILSIISKNEEQEREEINNEKDPTIKKIKTVLFGLNDFLKYDGGHVFFANYEDNIVYIIFTGGCAACEHQDETIQGGILIALQEEIPEIKQVINIPLPFGI
ncbi:MAG: NifU family protein [Candidatus Coprovivens sp.]